MCTCTCVHVMPMQRSALLASAAACQSPPQTENARRTALGARRSALDAATHRVAIFSSQAKARTLRTLLTVSSALEVAAARASWVWAAMRLIIRP